MTFPRAVAIVVALLGVVVLAGWAFDIGRVKSVLDGAVEMKPNTAVALVLSAIAIHGRSCESRWLRGTAIVAAGLVALVGIVTAIEYVGHFQFGIDERLFPDTTRAFAPVPGRMSPYSAVAFTLLGTILLVADRRPMRIPCLIGAFTIAGIGFISALGYLWQATELTTAEWAPPVALHTAIAFVLLGLAAPWSSRSQAAELRMLLAAIARRGIETKVLAAFLVAPAVITIVGGITYRVQSAFAESARVIAAREHARTVLGNSFAAILDTESAQRKYLLLNDPRLRAEYLVRAAISRSEIAELRETFAGDVVAAADLDPLVREIGHSLDLLSRHADIFDRLGAQAARDAIVNDDGIATMDAIRAHIAVLDVHEKAAIAAATANFSRNRTHVLIALVGTLVVTTMILFGFFLSILHDMRLRARMIEALDSAKQEANRANDAKSQFLASMSHEIRTPMNGVIGLLELLQHSSLPAQQQEMVRLSRESADSLLRILDDVLDFSKIEAGKLELESRPFDLAELTEKSCAMLNRLAARKQVSLAVHCHPAIPRQVVGDATRVRQVIVNLTSNAIKFCSGLDRPGRAGVRLEPGPLLAGRPTVIIRVRDNGIGMDAPTQARLFGAFVQADASTTRRYGGTGLGLAISRQLVALMHGTIQVESLPDAGTTFSVTLPFDLPAGDPAPDPSPPAALHGVRCLLAGDEAALADLGATLSAAGAEVAPASLQEALAACSPGAVGVVAVEASRAPALLQDLASHSRPDATPRVVIVASGYPQPCTASAGGCVLVDGNALGRRTLFEAVATAAGHEAGQLPVPAHATLKAAHRKAPTREEAVRDGRLILVAEDHDINQRVIREQLRLIGYASDVAADGRAALERWRSGQYALLLVDLHMPEMDGYDLTMAVRLEERGERRMPIIALTANALPDEADRCRAIGMDDYMTKPAPLESLAMVLQKWLPLPPAAPTPSATTPLVTGGAVDLAVLQRMVGHDPALIRELLAEFYRSAVEQGRHIIEAVAAEQHLDAAEAAHRLKSSARSVGALQLGQLCDDLETAIRAGDWRAMASAMGPFQGVLRSVLTELDAALGHPG